MKEIFDLIPLLAIFPLISLILGFLMKNKDEFQIFMITLMGVILNFIVIVLLIIAYFQNGMEPYHQVWLDLYHSSVADFTVNFYIDGIGLVFLTVSALISMFVIIFSRYYIHRESGFKRFFNNLKFFYLGLTVIMISGNFETLFLGWEIIGVTSFFLIGFYRQRYLPVKNALKVVSLYRLADIALLTGIWISHHYFAHSVSFHEFEHIVPGPNHTKADWVYQFFIPCVFLLAAVIKSAQFPFSSWLPRAMEGPTTSSSIFYGSLSVHMGVFLLLRTAPIWEDNLTIKILIIIIGVLTSLIATFSARVQSTIKTQIAYSAISQIGLMFIEIGFGLYWLAIIHFVVNAFLRSYQLLISPSVLGYGIHEQFYHFKKPSPHKTGSFLNKIKMTIYMFGIKEFNLDKFMHGFLWTPIKWIGKIFNWLNPKWIFIVFIPFIALGFYGLYHQDYLSKQFLIFLPVSFSILAFLLVSKSFVERKSAFSSWFMIIISQFFLAVSIGFNEHFDYNQLLIFLSGVVLSGIIGTMVILYLSRSGKDTSLNQFQGYVYYYPKLAFVFALAYLGLAGFPITPTFLGEDLILGHIHENQYSLLILTSLNLILDGLVVFRIYSRLMLGPRETGDHSVATRSS